MAEEKELESVEQQVPKETLIDWLERADRFEGPVGELLKALGARLEFGPRWSLRNSLLLYGFIVVIVAVLSVLTWFGKIASDVLMFTVGLLIGLLSHYIRGIFPSKG